MHDLKPCPFCHATGLGYVVADAGSMYKLDPDGCLGIDQPGPGWWHVRCRECDATGPKVKATRANAVEKSVEAWNGRDDEGRLF